MLTFWREHLNVFLIHAGEDEEELFAAITDHTVYIYVYIHVICLYTCLLCRHVNLNHYISILIHRSLIQSPLAKRRKTSARGWVSTASYLAKYYQKTKNTLNVTGCEHPSAISFFRVHTILHDILGFYTIYDIITRYLQYFRFGKNVRKLQEMRH